MDKQNVELKIPCPNCSGKNFGTMPDLYCILPSLVKDDQGYKVAPDQGLAVMPVICNECGFILFFHPHQKKS